MGATYISAMSCRARRIIRKPKFMKAVGAIRRAGDGLKNLQPSGGAPFAEPADSDVLVQLEEMLPCVAVRVEA